MSDIDKPQRKVLVAWDGSPAAASAFSVARLIADQLGASVEAIYVAASGSDWEERGAQLSQEAARLGCAIRMTVGDAADEIVRCTEEPGVAFVALTTHGRELETGYRLGSVAASVVARTHRPVLIVKPESAEVVGAVRRLLVPVDGAPKTAAALQPVMALALELHASVDLLYVAAPSQKQPQERGSIPAPRYVDQPHHEWPQWAAEVVHRLAVCCAGCPSEVPVNIFLAQGEVGEEIVRFALEHRSDAIVLVRRSRLQPERAKVIRAVLAATSCLVIVVGGEES